MPVSQMDFLSLALQVREASVSKGKITHKHCCLPATKLTVLLVKRDRWGGCSVSVLAPQETQMCKSSSVLSTAERQECWELLPRAWQKQECCSEGSVAPSSHKTPNYRGGGGEGYISKFVAEIITRKLSHTLKRLSLCHALQLLDVCTPILVIRSLKNTANNRRSLQSLF